MSTSNQMSTSNKDTDLIERLNVAVKAADEAQEQVGTANAELVSRSKVVGTLLLEAKGLHPKVKDFDAFIQRVHGLQLSRAYDLLRLAGGRTTDEELRKATKERVKKHRAKKNQTPKPKPEQKPISVTTPDVTESARALGEFKYACDHWLPQLSDEDLAAAGTYVDSKLAAESARRKDLKFKQRKAA